jgi:6-phosphofructokinase 1
MKFAVLTGGGDSSGMNAFVRAIVRSALNIRTETSVWGVLDGWKGLIYNDFRQLDKGSVAGIASAGGTILGTVRVPDLATDPILQESAARNLHDNRIDYLFVCGGNGSIKAAHAINTLIKADKIKTKVLCAPGSIDNDVCNSFGSSIGFYSALDKSHEMLEWIKDTASSHRRVYLIKSMGRDSAYLAFYSGIAAGAEYVICPGEHVDYEYLATMIEERDRDTRIIVAEGYDQDLHTIRKTLEDIFKKRNVIHEIRTVDMSYFQRGGKAAVADIIRASWVAYRMVKDAYAYADSGFYTAFYTGHAPTPIPLDIAADDNQTNHVGIPNEIIDFSIALR